MKHIRNILAFTCCALLLLGLTAAQAEVTAPATARFAVCDMNVSYVYAGATMDEAEAVFGAPASTESVTSAATGETQELWYYDGLTLTFSGEDTLIAASVEDAAYLGPRGVAVGQTLEEVASKFYYDFNNASNTVLYTAGHVDLLDAELPPCGYILPNDDGTYSINYAAPSVPFSDDLLADPTDFVYEELALLTVTFNADGTAVWYTWVLGPWAE
jgi:hypothetical protein